MGTTRDDGSQQSMWVSAADLPRGGGHPFYERLNRILEAAGFDAFVEGLCAQFYAAKMGRPGLAPGRYFRLLLIGYFEGLDSERAIAWRAAEAGPPPEHKTAGEDGRKPHDGTNEEARGSRGKGAGSCRSPDAGRMERAGPDRQTPSLTFAMLAMEHGRAVLILIESGLSVRLSAMALVRPMIQAVARAIWARTASDAEIAKANNDPDESNKGLSLFEGDGNQKLLKRLAANERAVVEGVRKVLASRSSEEKLENGQPKWLTLGDLWNRAVHGNVCVARQLANAEGFGSEHVPEEYGNEALDWATSWMLLTVELVLASVHAEPARFKRLHEISDQWQRALEEYKGGF